MICSGSNELVVILVRHRNPLESGFKVLDFHGESSRGWRMVNESLL